jgi:hypothetical protein
MKLCILSCAYEKPELASILAESCERAHLPLMFCEAAELKGVWPGAVYSDGRRTKDFEITYRMAGEPTPEWIATESAATEDRYAHLRNQ